MALGPKRFNWRAFFSLYVVISFVVMAVTGLVLFATPPGRVANWSEWRLAGLTKEEWQAIHTTFTLVFLVAASFHVYYNWNILLSYLRNRMRQGVPRKRELAWSAVAATALLALTLADVPPVSYIMETSETLSASWSTSTTEPPVPHAELLTLAKLADTVKVPIERISVKLEAAGIDRGADDATVGEIAERAGLTPSELYARVMEGEAKPAVSLVEGGGYGQKNVRQMGDQLQVPVEVLLDNLRRKGIEADADSNVRDLAKVHGKLPIDIVKLMQGATMP